MEEIILEMPTEPEGYSANTASRGEALLYDKKLNRHVIREEK
jgi:hypothetical protein